MNQQKYQNFLNFLFNRTASDGDWRFDIEHPILTGEEVCSFTKHMLENYETDIAQYTDKQIAEGLEFIFNNSFSDYAFFIRDEPTPIDLRVSTIKALIPFFKHCLNKRCLSVLGHLSETGNELNHFCYMLWDATPLSYCQSKKEKYAIYEAIREVMAYSLTLDNIACIESGLHGLGHLKLYDDTAPSIIQQFIKTFNKKNKQIDQRISHYAKNAEVGNIL